MLIIIQGGALVGLCYAMLCDYIICYFMLDNYIRFNLVYYTILEHTLLYYTTLHLHYTTLVQGGALVGLSEQLLISIV